MSREVTGTASDRDASDAGSRTPPLRSRTPRRRPVVGLAVVALALPVVGVGAALLLTGPDSARNLPAASTRGPSAPGPGSPTATPPPAGASTRGDGAATDPGPSVPRGNGLDVVVLPGPAPSDLVHLDVTIEVRNALDTRRTLVDLDVRGLGPALVDPVEGRVVPAGGSVSVPAQITADCVVRQHPTVRFLVTQRRDDGTVVDEEAVAPPAETVQGVLDRLCPPVEPGLHVVVAAFAPAPGGEVAVRVVNHGRVSAVVAPRAAPDAGPARLVSDPPLPYDLAPGDSVVARLDVRLRPGSGCLALRPAAVAAALSLEGETPYGFGEVTGLPPRVLADTVRQRVERAGCPHRSDRG